MVWDDISDEERQRQRRQIDVWTTQLLRTCGQHADLVIECVRTVFTQFNPLESFAHRQMTRQERTTVVGAVPLQMALQIGRGQCDACSPLGRLRIVSVELSGSQTEGLCNHWNDHCLPTALSDHDYMCELGPVSWASEVGPGSDPVAGTAYAARLSVAATENPGFVRLLQTRQPACRHGRQEEFSADPVRRWMCDLMRVCMNPEDGEQLGVSGPASAVTRAEIDPTLSTDKDMVPCLRAPWWPADEFLERSRDRSWPSPAVVENIRQFGVHLVPTGCPGSGSAQSEWRLSFSRAEIVVAWLLSQRQRHAVLTLKACKTALGAPGKAVKSYFLKTSLLWLVQERSANEWGSIRQGATTVLDFLEAAINARRLPCFFWADIDLLKFTTTEELAAMRRTVALLRRSLPRMLMRSCADMDVSPVEHLLGDGGGQPLPEHQLRVRLVRWLLVDSVQTAVGGVSLQDCYYLRYATLAAAVPYITTTELLRIHQVELGCLQVVWFRALLLLLPTDRTPGWPRLEAAADGTFSWDASPLVALLTDTDLQQIMWRPHAVFAWCERHRPAGLTASPRSVRGLTQLLLRPPLLQRAIMDSVPGLQAAVRRRELNRRARYIVPGPLRLPLEECRRAELRLCGHDPVGLLQHRLGLNRHSAEQVARHWWLLIGRYWSQVDTRGHCTKGEDRWELHRYTGGCSD